MGVCSLRNEKKSLFLHAAKASCKLQSCQFQRLCMGTRTPSHTHGCARTHSGILVLAPSETIRPQPSLLIMTLCIDNQTTPSPEWPSPSLHMTPTQVEETIPGKVKASLHSAKVALKTNTACFRDLAGKLKRNPRCSRLRSWFPGNQMLGAGRERGFLLVPDSIDRQWALTFRAKEMGRGRRKPADASLP